LDLGIDRVKIKVEAFSYNTIAFKQVISKK